MKILVVQHDKAMAGLLVSGLQKQNCVVTIAHDGASGFRIAEKQQFDVIVLDWMLPGLSGLEFLNRLRKAGNSTPILMLTARDGLPEVTAALENSSDDFLTKSFSFVELIARLRALARRAELPEAKKVYQTGEITLDASAHRVFRGALQIHLTRTEYRLLECLIRRRGTAVSRRSIIESVWGVGADVEENTLDTFIRLLRKKVEIAGKPRLIETVRGFGYRMGDVQ